MTTGGSPYVAALRRVNLTFRAGECVALIGPNGSGKTTLLRTLAGIYEPSDGSVYRHGSTATMFSSTLSLSDMETGRQNIGVSGILHGIPSSRMATVFEHVVDVCGLGDFIDVPVVLYSEGMRARLGLAMALMARPEILLVDEAMTTTDSRFLGRIRETTRYFGHPETLTIVATHSADITTALCNRALWLEGGEVKAFGDYSTIMTRYRDETDSVI